jgi:hypothetical protein
MSPARSVSHFSGFNNASWNEPVRDHNQTFFSPGAPKKKPSTEYLMTKFSME